MRTSLALLAALTLGACNDGAPQAEDPAAVAARNEAEARRAREAQTTCFAERQTLIDALAANDAELARLRSAPAPEAAQALATAEAAHTRIAAELEAKKVACQALMRDRRPRE